MSGQHAGPPHPAVPGECGWTWHHCGTWLYCDNEAVEGTDECRFHLAARLHAALETP